MTSPDVPGMLTRAELEDAIRRKEIDTVLAVFPDMYGRLLGKRLTGHFFLEHAAEDGMHVCDYLLACDMEMDPVPGYTFTSWETGYGDMHWTPDWTTARRAAWLPKTALILGDMHTADGTKPIEVAPRRMLQRQLERAREMGYTVMGGTEIELYVFHETYESARNKRYADLKTSGSYIEDYHILQGTKEENLIGAIRRYLDDSGVPVESSKGEWGPGQQEINLFYCDALTQADRNVLYKHAAKEIAGIAGQGSHLHGEMGRDARGFQYARPSQSVENRRRQCVCGRKYSGESAVFRDVSGLSWRAAASRPCPDRLFRAQCCFL